MKKQYIACEAEICLLAKEDIMTLSGGTEDGTGGFSEFDQW